MTGRPMRNRGLALRRCRCGRTAGVFRRCTRCRQAPALYQKMDWERAALWKQRAQSCPACHERAMGPHPYHLPLRLCRACWEIRSASGGTLSERAISGIVRAALGQRSYPPTPGGRENAVDDPEEEVTD